MNTIMSHSFNIADYIIIAVILLSTLTSLMRGFISEAISLVTWIIAVYVALQFSGLVSNYFTGIIHNPTIRFITGFIIIFLVILIIGSIINHFLSVFVISTGLTGTNRILGMVFGFARGVLLVALFVLFAKMTSMVRTPWWQDSQLIPYFLGIAAWLQQFIPTSLTNVSHYFTNPKPGTS